jgi:hypothetical protein
MGVHDHLKQLELSSRKNRSILDPLEVKSLIGEGSWTERMLLCRLIARVDWSVADARILRTFVLDQTRDQNKFVKAWSMDALANLAKKDSSLVPQLDRMIQDALETGSSAVRVRARRLLKQTVR